MSRPRHPDKHIEGAVQHAESLGRRVQMSNGPAWGFLLCPQNTRDGCSIGVYSTPRKPEITPASSGESWIDAHTEATPTRTSHMTTENDCVGNHEFVLVLSGVPVLDERVMNALFEAGCDDATPSLRFGVVSLTFDREAVSRKEAILSAIRDVIRAGIGARVKSVDDCHLVTQADIARRIDRSRQLVHQFIAGVRGRGGFPGPVCHLNEGAPLWRWSEVATWLWRNDMIKEEIVRTAREVEMINGVLEMQSLRQEAPELLDEVVLSVTTCETDARR